MYKCSFLNLLLAVHHEAGEVGEYAGPIPRLQITNVIFKGTVHRFYMEPSPAQ